MNPAAAGPVRGPAAVADYYRSCAEAAEAGGIAADAMFQLARQRGWEHDHYVYLHHAIMVRCGTAQWLRREYSRLDRDRLWCAARLRECAELVERWALRGGQTNGG